MLSKPPFLVGSVRCFEAVEIGPIRLKCPKLNQFGGYSTEERT